MITIFMFQRRIRADKTGGFHNEGTLFTFEDGSTVEAASGAIDNRGPGEIQVQPQYGEGKTEETPVTRGPFRFDHVNHLGVQNLTAEVRIEPWEGPGTEVTITGPASDVETILFEVGRVLMNPEDMVLALRGHGDGCTATIRVPRGTSINLKQVKGTTSIGDVGGEFRLTNTVGGTTRCGRVSDARIRLMGLGKVTIAEVNEPVGVHVTGLGRVMVEAGHVTDLLAKIEGDGTFELYGKADTANLTVIGSGTIRVMETASPAVTKLLGDGTITVVRTVPPSEHASSAQDTLSGA